MAVWHYNICSWLLWENRIVSTGRLAAVVGCVNFFESILLHYRTRLKFLSPEMLNEVSEKWSTTFNRLHLKRTYRRSAQVLMRVMQSMLLATRLGVTLAGCVTRPALYDSARLTAETRVAQGYSSIVGSLWALYGTWGYRWLVSPPRRANFLDATLLLSCPGKLGWRLLIWTADSTVVQHEPIKGIVIVIVFVIKSCVNTKAQQLGRGRRPTALQAHKWLYNLSYVQIFCCQFFLLWIYLAAVAMQD